MSGECDECGEHAVDHEGLLSCMRENFDMNINYMFNAASTAIVEDTINDFEFKLCKNMIMTAIEYLEAKREKK